MTSEVLRLIGNIGIVLALIPYIGFVVLYALLSDWRHSEYGVHLMSFMGSITVVLFLIAVRTFLISGPVPLWYEVTRIVTFVVLIPPMAFWRLALLIREQRDVRRLRGEVIESTQRVRNES